MKPMRKLKCSRSSSKIVKPLSAQPKRYLLTWTDFTFHVVKAKGSGLGSVLFSAFPENRYFVLKTTFSEPVPKWRSGREDTFISLFCGNQCTNLCDTLYFVGSCIKLNLANFFQITEKQIYLRVTKW